MRMFDKTCTLQVYLKDNETKYWWKECVVAFIYSSPLLCSVDVCYVPLCPPFRYVRKYFSSCPYVDILERCALDISKSSINHVPTTDNAFVSTC